MPRIIFIVVDLPEPFGPRSPRISPFLTLRLMLLTAWIRPKDLESEVASRAGPSMLKLGLAPLRGMI